MSLFNGSCCGNTAGTTQRRSNGDGAVGEILSSFVNRGVDFCRVGAVQPVVRLIPKGHNVPLNLEGGTTADSIGTLFTLVSYDAFTHTAIFTYDAGAPGAPVIRQVALDVRSLAGIICVTPA
jgi:hypothetical protein